MSPLRFEVEGRSVLYPDFLDVEIKIVATRCQILSLKFTKFDLGWGCALDPLRELTALPQTPGPSWTSWI